MPSTYTSRLRLVLPATGENIGTWGTLVNASLTNLLDSAIAGYGDVNMSDANYTLTANNGSADQSRAMFINMTGTLTAARNVIVPTPSKLYFFKNSTTGGYALTFKTSAGTGISIPNGSTAALMCDGTNVIEAVTYVATISTASLAVSGTSTFTGAATFSSTVNKVTITPPTTSATLTLVDGSSLVTSGANSITLTSTGATNVTLPTSGTLLTTTGTGAGLTAVDAITLLGNTWAAPEAIGSGTPAAGSFTTLGASGTSTLAAVTATTVSGTGLIRTDLSGAGSALILNGGGSNLQITVGNGGNNYIFNSSGGTTFRNDGNASDVLFISGSASGGVRVGNGTTATNKLWFGQGDSTEFAFINYSDSDGILSMGTPTGRNFGTTVSYGGTVVTTVGNGTFTVAGTVSTTDPAGGAGPTWKLGVAASVSPTSPNRTIRIDIGGTSYYLAAKTTND